MTKKLFKNRIMQEDEKTIRKLKSTYIEMNTDKETTDDTYDGLFFISLQMLSKLSNIYFFDSSSKSSM